MVQVDPTPSPFDRMSLPAELPDSVHASWVAALMEFRDSTTYSSGEQHYQFCNGYVQALRDAHVIDERLCRFLVHQVQHIWVGMQAPMADPKRFV